jgi:hypothetical protein
LPLFWRVSVARKAATDSDQGQRLPPGHVLHWFVHAGGDYRLLGLVDTMFRDR